jgi:hypothetical protein
MKTCCVIDPFLCAHGATDSLSQFHSPQYYVFGPDAWKLTATNTPIVARINTDTATRRTWEVRCDEGHYCIAGERFPCPAGRYGNERVRVVHVKRFDGFRRDMYQVKRRRVFKSSNVVLMIFTASNFVAWVVPGLLSSEPFV